MLQNNPQLKSLIDKLWNNFWSGGISNPLTAIEQITYLIFMKRLDDLETKRERDAEFIGEKYKSRFSGKFKVPGSKEFVDKKNLRWSKFKHFTANEILLHIQTKVFPFLKELNGDASPFTHHMQNAVFIIPKASLLAETINIIESIFSEIERDANEGGHAFQDIQGDVYEMLLSEIATAGKNGQFRTPRHIIKLMAELVAPQLGQRVADPACGTGGFLLGAYQFMLTDYIRKKDPKKIVKDEDGFERGALSSAVDKKVKSILDDSFYGYDIDTTMVRLGLMNLMMHGIDEPHIDYRDTLSKKFNEDGRYDIVLANPPFTGNIDAGDINENLKLPTTKSELLFVERIFNMLRMGGTAGVIVPQGVLFGSGKAFVTLRKKLIEECELKAVITLPSGVFKPYAGVSTAILIFTKGGETEHTWFYEMQADGYSLDDKRSKIEQSDLMDIVGRFQSRNPKKDTNRTEKAFFVPKQEIVGDKPEESKYDLSLNKYKEEVYEEIEYESPKLILEKLEILELQIQTGLKELKSRL
ncbi:type I restriction-modification system subunit M [Leptospira noguchii]|uniref:site-specific DNA-methyltransferase (adenine-specific) n=1 Tax=Leptospira noguchii TaxID=28182 RepID=M6VAM4_9LEPT|nr:type I restriction-modification system subunit M [Leptospira noguchii]EMO52081.1 N-6 DNA Methylase [Leptospira noguchii]